MNDVKRVVVIGAGYRGAGKSLTRALALQLLAEQAAFGRVVEVSVGYDRSGEIVAFDECREVVGTTLSRGARGPVLLHECGDIPAMFLSAKMLAPEAPIRVVSSGRHGGGKGRKAHKKRAAIFGHGWQ